MNIPHASSNEAAVNRATIPTGSGTKRTREDLVQALAHIEAALESDRGNARLVNERERALFELRQLDAAEKGEG
jgi:hypothetical protein